MNRTTQRLAIGAALLIILLAATAAIWRFEHTLSSGKDMILQLAPVDPRSIMQGDYMALAYAIDRELPDEAGKFKYVWLSLSDQGIASLHSLSNDLPQQQGLIGVLLRQRDGIYSVGPNGFFFAEGTAAVYEAARYGQFKVDSKGKALLTALLDEELQLLGENLR
tara:strand:- start:194 stop:688 length:495 start_codon:yes stop_codon:yes gene_type:complete